MISTFVVLGRKIQLIFTSMSSPSSKGYQSSIRRKRGGGTTKGLGGTAKDRVGGAIEATRFWGSFLDDPQAAMSNAKFIKYLWMGIPDDWDLRRQIWPAMCPKIAQAPKLSSKLDKNKLDGSILDQIQIELEYEDCFSALGDDIADKVDLSLVEKLVIALHIYTNHTQRYLPGSVQLAAMMLHVCDHHLHEAFKILSALVLILDEMLIDQQLALKTQCLVIADLIARDIPKLAAVFNSMDFDVVDFSDVVCLWTAPVFIYHFPRSFVLRVLDLLFYQGPSALIGVLFGVISTFSDTLIESADASALYKNFHWIPPSVSLKRMDQCFKEGFDLIYNFPEVLEMHSNKDWRSCMELHGKIPSFEVKVGDSVLVRNHLETRPVHVRSMSDFDEVEKKEEVFEEPQFTFSLVKVKDSTSESTFSEIQKLLDVNVHLTLKLEELQKNAQDKNSRIARLENDLERLEDELKLQKASDFGGTLRMPKINTNISRLIADKLTLEHGGVSAIELSETKVRSENDKYDSFSLNEFDSRFSMIYETLEFPCVYMEGYLFKLSKSGLFAKHNLMRKFFVLKGRYLTFFKTHVHTKPSKDRCMDVGGANIAQLESHDKGQFCFEIRKGKRQFILFAPDQKSLYQWLIALKAAVVL